MAKPRIGLVLTGGGARAAYQVGVLKAISHMLPGLAYPFDVITGTSAGAINAILLAGGGAIFNHAVERMDQIWSSIEHEQIYRSDFLGLSSSMTRFLQGALLGESSPQQAAMLNNAPLRELLSEHLRFEQVREAIASGQLHGVGVNACGYTSGRNICFFEAQSDVNNWALEQRTGVRDTLTVDHIMASAAIPTIFPPIRLHREYFGDGATRQMAHLSPALHLGADKLIIVGVSANRTHHPLRKDSEHYPNMGQIMENVLNGMFLDTLEFDIERLSLTNTLLAEVPDVRRLNLPVDVRHVPFIEISPTRPIYDIARKHMGRLPAIIRRIMGHNLQHGEGGVSLASYLLFDREFCRELVRQGYTDAQKKAGQIEEFLIGNR
ncbi:MAG: patatin-like phospholipase family protein [Hahellaceae bacterium]|nr:patatin-like phospholipase family protein [Hahellaceae bacterium]